jgi:hypothetical protein
MARGKSIEIQEVLTSLIPARRLNRRARAHRVQQGHALDQREAAQAGATRSASTERRVITAARVPL